MKKLKIGVFSFTCDEGCSMKLLEIFNEKFFEWLPFLDVKSFRLLTPRNEVEDLDVAFVEGAVSTEREVEFLKKVRENSKKLVAIGSCAITGFPSNNRNFFNEKQLKGIEPFLKKFNHLKKVEPVSKFVKVDAVVNGCPMDADSFVSLFESFLKEVEGYA